VHPDPHTTLHAKRTELLARLADREVIEVVREADPLDNIFGLNCREVSALDVDRWTRLLAQVEAALLRLDTPAWGICAECGEKIAPKRLAAVPWAECCIRCADEAERSVAA
jgi:DnaK suppressor protein